MKKKRIGVDIDGVIYPFVDTFRQYVAQQLGVSADGLCDPPQWAFWTDWSLTKEQFIRLFDDYILAAGFTRGEIFSGAINAIRKMQERHQVIFLTARGTAADAHSNLADIAKMDTIKWLGRNGLGDIPLTFSSTKGVLGLDVHIDDAVHHLEECDNAGIIPICYDASHNKQWLGHRVEKWEEVPLLLEAIL